jgi:hypothetical protein
MSANLLGRHLKFGSGLIHQFPWPEKFNHFIYVMKAIQSFLIVALIAVVAVGCGKVEKILPKKDGKWKTTKQEQRYYENDVLQSTTTDITTTSFTFQKDGTGSLVDNGSTDAFTWSVNSDNDEITLCQDFGGVSICFTYDIVESKSTTQVWFGEIVDGSDRTEMDIELERE